MKYQVPQFIEVEDKIFGPLTFKQFVFIAGGAGVCFICYKLLSGFWAVVVATPAIAAAAALAFYKPNNRPLLVTLEAAFNFLVTSKLYIWKKEDKKPKAQDISAQIQATKSSVLVPKISESKLKDLAWSLDINETIYSSKDGRLQGREGAQNRNSF